MQAAASRPRRTRRRGIDNRALGRALRYLRSYPRLALGATLALIVATAAQLAVPQFVQNIIDTIVDNAITKSILDISPALQQFAADRLGLDLTAARADLAAAPRLLLIAGLVVVLFAVARGLFTFAQNYLSQALSQEIAV